MHGTYTVRAGETENTPARLAAPGKRKRKPKLRSMTLNIPHARPHTPQRAQRHVHTLTRHALTRSESALIVHTAVGLCCMKRRNRRIHD